MSTFFDIHDVIKPSNTPQTHEEWQATQNTRIEQWQEEDAMDELREDYFIETEMDRGIERMLAARS